MHIWCDFLAPPVMVQCRLSASRSMTCILCGKGITADCTLRSRVGTAGVTVVPANVPRAFYICISRNQMVSPVNVYRLCKNKHQNIC